MSDDTTSDLAALHAALAQHPEAWRDYEENRQALKPLPALPEKPAPEPSREQVLAHFWNVMGEPLGLPDDALPEYRTIPEGTCRMCHRGPLYKDGRCLYCWSLAKMAYAASVKAESPPPPSPRAQVRRFDNGKHWGTCDCLACLRRKHRSLLSRRWAAVIIAVAAVAFMIAMVTAL